MEQRREARLRPEYASWYPGVTMAGWLPVTALVRAVTRQLLDGEPRGAPRWQVGHGSWTNVTSCFGGVS